MTFPHAINTRSHKSLLSSRWSEVRVVSDALAEELSDNYGASGASMTTEEINFFDAVAANVVFELEAQRMLLPAAFDYEEIKKMEHADDCRRNGLHHAKSALKVLEKFVDKMKSGAPLLAPQKNMLSELHSDLKLAIEALDNG
jgi:hypothetical protein